MYIAFGFINPKHLNYPTESEVAYPAAHADNFPACKIWTGSSGGGEVRYGKHHYICLWGSERKIGKSRWGEGLPLFYFSSFSIYFSWDFSPRRRAGSVGCPEVARLLQEW